MTRSPRTGNEPGSDLGRLPRGRHGLPRELVAENQRQRLIAGIIASVAEHGYNETTIATVTKAAGLSRRTFYEHFANKAACFSAAHEASFNFLRDSMLATADAADEWAERVRAGLAALLDTFAGRPEMANVFLIAPPSAGDEITDRHHTAMRDLVTALIAGPPPPPGPLQPSETRERALAGGISQLIVRKLNAGEAKQLPDLLPDLLQLVLGLFLGSEKAGRLARE